MNEAIDKWLTTIRSRHGLTLDSISSAARSMGASWTPGFLSALKRNNSASLLPNILILVAAINLLTKENYTINDVFKEAEDIQITDEISTSPAQLKSFFDGASIHFEIQEINEDFLQKLTEIITKFIHKYKLGGEATIAVTKHMLSKEGPTLAEQRAAQKLDIDPMVIYIVCQKLYGKTLEEEASNRAGEGASPQKRGRETRIILDEIRDALRNWDSIPDDSQNIKVSFSINNDKKDDDTNV